MPCSTQVLRTLGARRTDLRLLSLDNIYGEDNSSDEESEESEDRNQRVSGLALAVYTELPKALPWLEGLYMETDLIIEAFEWPAELAGSKSLRCAATRSIIYSVRALLRD